MDVVRANHRIPATRRMEAIPALAKCIRTSMDRRARDKLRNLFFLSDVLRACVDLKPQYQNLYPFPRNLNLQGTSKRAT